MPPPPAGDLPAMLTVDAGGMAILVRVRQDARARRLRVAVKGHAREAVVTVPPGVRRDIVDGFLNSHADWLRSALSALPPANPFVDGALVPFRGVPHILAGTGRSRGSIAISPGDPPSIDVPGDPEHLPRRLTDHFRKEARRDLQTVVDAAGATTGHRPTAIRIKDTRSRWGSCSSSGVLSFSWRLVLAPPSVLAYVARHEAAHLVEMNHGPRFWALVARLDPEWRTAERWLKENGPGLHQHGAAED